jgi:N-terminal acetyltransferase B complex catalytic subunit
MYEGMGYSVYRRVREYYGSLGLGKGGRDEEDAFG